jgi:hypothetical protein
MSLVTHHTSHVTRLSAGAGTSALGGTLVCEARCWCWGPRPHKIECGYVIAGEADGDDRVA